jgi:hypothetical protein
MYDWCVTTPPPSPLLQLRLQFPFAKKGQKYNIQIIRNSIKYLIPSLPPEKKKAGKF